MSALIKLAERDFCCAICQRVICMRWNRPGRDCEIMPICNSCERWYSERCGKPASGAFRDRREVRRGFALVNALHDEAARMKWSAIYASA